MRLFMSGCNFIALIMGVMYLIYGDLVNGIGLTVINSFALGIHFINYYDEWVDRRSNG